MGKTCLWECNRQGWVMKHRGLNTKAEISGMNGVLPHIGGVPCHRGKNNHKKWLWGMKKGLRRARRRLSTRIVREET